MTDPGSHQPGHTHASNDWIVVGRVLGAWGVRGDVRVEPQSDDPDRFSPGSRVFLDGSPTVVLSNRPHKGGLVVRLESVAARNAAEVLKGASLTVPREEVGPLPDGSFYHFEIIGLPVYTTDGEELGVVHEILATGSNDVYVVRDSAGKERLVPALNGVVLTVDLEGRRMTVELPEGL